MADGPETAITAAAEWAFRAWWLYWLDIEPADLEDLS